MKGTLGHVAIYVNDFDWYIDFFNNCFEMEMTRTRGEAPNRIVWFAEGIQVNEAVSPETLGDAIDHICLKVADVPAAVAEALTYGCTTLPNGAHWFALPNGIKVELKPL